MLDGDGEDDEAGLGRVGDHAPEQATADGRGLTLASAYVHTGDADSPERMAEKLAFIAATTFGLEAMLDVASRLADEAVDDGVCVAAGACSQLSARARIRALVVLPQPRGPEKR